MTIFLVVKSLAYIIVSPWKIEVTQPPKPKLGWICASDSQIVLKAPTRGLVLIELHGNYVITGILGSDLSPVPYYIDYVNSNFVRIWVNVSRPGLLHLLEYGTVSWSNGYLTFSRIEGAYMINYFTDFRSLDGWTILNGSVSLLGWNPELQSYGFLLSEGTTILTMLYDPQRLQYFELHAWANVGKCLNIILSTKLDPTKSNVTLSYCGSGLHELIVKSNASGLYLYVDGRLVQSKPALPDKILWVGFVAYGAPARLYKMYFTPLHYTVLTDKYIVAKAPPCVNIVAETVNPAGQGIRLRCTLRDGSIVQSYTTETSARVVAFSEPILTCKVNGIVIADTSLGPVAESYRTKVIVNLWWYRDYTNTTRFYACSNSCIVHCYRTCGIALINASEGTLIAVNYSKKTTRLEVQGADYTWINNTVLLLQARKSHIAVSDEYMLCIYMYDTLHRPILLPRTYVYVDGQAYPTPMCTFYPAGRTNVTVPHNIYGFRLRELNGTNSSSIVFVLDRDVKVFAIYRVATRLTYRYYLTDAGNNKVNLTFVGKLADFYGVPIGHATIVAECNKTTASAVTREDGSFSVTLTLPKGKVYACTLYYSGNETYAGTMIQVIIQQTPPIQLTAIIALAIAIVGVVLYVLLRRKRERQS